VILLRGYRFSLLAVLLLYLGCSEGRKVICATQTGSLEQRSSKKEQVARVASGPIERSDTHQGHPAVGNMDVIPKPNDMTSTCTAVYDA
jgi:hypothetical protein